METGPNPLQLCWSVAQIKASTALRPESVTHTDQASGKLVCACSEGCRARVLRLLSRCGYCCRQLRCFKLPAHGYG